MAEEHWDKAIPHTYNKVVDWIDRMLDSHESANVLIILLIMLAIFPIIGMGVLLTRGAAPAPTPPMEIQN